jgi:hypothetical protein
MGVSLLSRLTRRNLVGSGFFFGSGFLSMAGSAASSGPDNARQTTPSADHRIARERDMMETSELGVLERRFIGSGNDKSMAAAKLLFAGAVVALPALREKPGWRRPLTRRCRRG